MGLPRYIVYFNKQQSNSSFTHSREREKSHLLAGTQSAGHWSYKNPNWRKGIEGILIYTVRMRRRKHLMRGLICSFEKVLCDHSVGARLQGRRRFHTVKNPTWWESIRVLVLTTNSSSQARPRKEPLHSILPSSQLLWPQLPPCQKNPQVFDLKERIRQLKSLKSQWWHL